MVDCFGVLTSLKKFEVDAESVYEKDISILNLYLTQANKTTSFSIHKLKVDIKNV